MIDRNEWRNRRDELDDEIVSSLTGVELLALIDKKRLRDITRYMFFKYERGFNRNLPRKLVPDLLIAEEFERRIVQLWQKVFERLGRPMPIIRPGYFSKSVDGRALYMDCKIELPSEAVAQDGSVNWRIIFDEEFRKAREELPICGILYGSSYGEEHRQFGTFTFELEKLEP